jgi:hypothetical protein
VIPEIAGTLRVNGRCPEHDCEASSAGTDVQVRVPDLVDLQAGLSPDFLLVDGATAWPPDNRWAHPGLVARLIETANALLAPRASGAFPRGLELTELSLRAGGLFDIAGLWRVPHNSHRRGLDADVRVNDLLLPTQRLWLENALRASLGVAKPFPVKGEAPGPQNVTHWHVRVAAGSSPSVALGSQFATGCPVPPNGVDAQVQATASFDPARGTYEYSYTVASGVASVQDIASFAIAGEGPILSAESPNGWNAVVRGRHVYWFAEAPDASWVDDGFGIPPGAARIRPGTALGGFVLRSASAPGVVPAHVTGHIPMTAPVSEQEAEALAELCDQAPSSLATSVTGPGAALSFYTVSPCRVLDTRSIADGILVAAEERTFAVSGKCGVPADARSVSLNVAVTAPSAAGHLRVWPADGAVPLTSTINFSRGQTRSNNAIVGLDAFGLVRVRSEPEASVHLIVDVNGYFR